MKKSISLFLILYFSVTVCNSQNIIGRKYFSYPDSIFQVGEVKILISSFDCWSNIKNLSALDSVYLFLMNHLEIGIEIGCHTDSRGNENYNLFLSQNRADSAYDYLIKKGIDPMRISHKGYGATQPLVVEIHADGSDCEKCLAQNRRTEIRITCINYTRSFPQKIYDPVTPTDPFEFDHSIPAQYENADDLKKNSPK